MSLSMTSLTENICMFTIVFTIQVKGVGYVDCKLDVGISVMSVYMYVVILPKFVSFCG